MPAKNLAHYLCAIWNGRRYRVAGPFNSHAQANAWKDRPHLSKCPEEFTRPSKNNPPEPIWYVALLSEQQSWRGNSYGDREVSELFT